MERSQNVHKVWSQRRLVMPDEITQSMTRAAIRLCMDNKMNDDYLLHLYFLFINSIQFNIIYLKGNYKHRSLSFNLGKQLSN
jgi:hypothetical protein